MPNTKLTEPEVSPSDKAGKTLIERIASLFHEEDADERLAVREMLREAFRRNIFDEEALSMMEGALSMSDIRASDLMVPRAKVNAVDFSEPRSQWLPKLIATGHSRFPAVEDDLDNVLGILHAKDLLQLLVKPDADPKRFIRPARFIPETQPVNLLLRDFKAQKSHLALVIDEYGSVSGLITIEDVIEQIVGDISDEFDRDTDSLNIMPDGAGLWRVKAVTTLEQFNAYFGSDLEDDFCETVGGLVTDRLEHVPHAGEVVVEKGFRFRILLGDDRQARLLAVEKADA